MEKTGIGRGVVLAAALLAGVGPARALTLHRSFRPREVGVGGGASVVVPGIATRTGSQFQPDAASAKAPKSLVGTVTGVVDGDTLWVTPTGGARTKVQLLRIDAPEFDQPFGPEAKAFLSELVLGKKVEVQYSARDRAGCLGGVVFLKHEKGMVDVNLTLVRNGLAWHDDARDKTAAYADGQARARGEGRGLWSAASPVHPAEWAKSRRGAR